MGFEPARVLFCVRADIEAYFGRDNVRQWADLNNNNVELDISARITLAISTASAVIEARLRGGPYADVGTDPGPDADEPILVQIAVQLAGDHLYTPRGAQDFNEDGRPLHRLRGEREDALATLSQIRAGLIRFDSTTERTSIPEVQPVATSIDDED